MNQIVPGIRSVISVGRTIEAPAPAVWRLLVDTRQRPLWGPSVKAVDIALPIIGPGSRGQVIAIGGIRLPFEVTRFEAGRYWSWKVGGVQATGHRVVAIDPRRCQLVFEVPIWAAPYATVCLWAIKRIQDIIRGTADRG